MNATQTHFVAVCPHCSTGLKVRRVYLGQPVACKQCSRQFLGEERDEPGTSAFGEGEVVAGTPAPLPEDRIIATCPNCQATLRVRRQYIGNNVICKECERMFLVLPPAEGPSNSTVNGPGQAEYDRLQSAYRGLQSEHAQLADRLEQRGLELDAARAEQEQMGLAEEAALAEADRLRSEADQLRAECDRLRLGIDEIRRAFEEDERTEREELARVEAELVGLAARNEELQDLYESNKRLCAEYQERNQGLLEELARLRSELTAPMHPVPPLETDRTVLPHGSLEDLWEITDYDDTSPSHPEPKTTPAYELRGLRIEVEHLKRRLTDSERLQSEMVAILAGMGIRIRQV